jgi:hypothetical protein
LKKQLAPKQHQKLRLLLQEVIKVRVARNERM